MGRMVIHINLLRLDRHLGFIINRFRPELNSSPEFLGYSLSLHRFPQFQKDSSLYFNVKQALFFSIRKFLISVRILELDLVRFHLHSRHFITLKEDSSPLGY